MKPYHWEFGWKVPLPVKLRLRKPHWPEVRVPRPKRRPRQKPERVIADRGYDSDPLCQLLRRRGIELIVPYRENNNIGGTKTGASFGGYKRRWIVARTNAWLDSSVGCWFVMNIYSVLIALSSMSPRSELRSGGVFDALAISLAPLLNQVFARTKSKCEDRKRSRFVGAV